MFQGEARFGRMVRIRRCWAEKPQRPTVCNGDEREFLAQLGAAHPSDFIIMVVDGASSHVAKGLVVPQNIRLLRLPPCAPELNPQEHVRGELRGKEFPNRVCADLDSVRPQLEAGLPRLADSHSILRSLTA